MRTFSGYSGRQHVKISLCIALSSVVLLAGCPIAGLLPGLPPYRIVGADGNRLLFVEQRGFDELVAFSQGVPPATRDLVAVNLETLVSEVVSADITALAEDIVANGDWVAWVDRVNQMVAVRDLNSGEESSYFEELVRSGDGLAVWRIDGDRLIVHHGVANPVPPDGPQYEFIVLDLDTGGETHVSGSWSYATFAIEGDYVALMTDAPTNVAPLGLELTTNIDLVNLATGDRQTIAPDLRVTGDGYAAGLFIVDGQVVWQEFKPGGFQTQVSSYDIATGTSAIRADDLKPSDGERWLRDVSGDRMLLERRLGHPLVGETVALELRTFDGGAVTIVEFPNTAKKSPSFATQPRLIEGLAVWTDPHSGEFVIYEPATGATRRFAPGS